MWPSTYPDCGPLLITYIVQCRDCQSNQKACASGSAPINKRTVPSLPLSPATSVPVSGSEVHPFRQTLLEALENSLLHDLKGVFENNPGRSVAISFLNSSLNSFLPSVNVLHKSTSSSFKKGTKRTLLQELSRRTNTTPQDCQAMIDSLRDHNPLLGVKGCRYLLMNPEFLKMQVGASLGAGLQVIREGNTAMGTVQFMIPMVSSEHETLAVVSAIKSDCEEFFQQHVRDRDASYPSVVNSLLYCTGLRFALYPIYRLDRESITRLELSYRRRGAYAMKSLVVLDICLL